MQEEDDESELVDVSLKKSYYKGSQISGQKSSIFTSDNFDEVKRTFSQILISSSKKSILMQDLSESKKSI